MSRHAEDPRSGSGTALLDERYGRDRRRGKRLLVAIAVVLALLGGGWLTWAVWLESTPDVRSGLVRSSVVDAHHVSAQVQVVLGGPHVVASCLLQAVAADHSVVGELNFRVGPVADERVSVERTMRTERRATVVNLIGCTTPDQPRPR